MVSSHIFYQLVLLGLLWLCIMLHLAWPSDRQAEVQLAWSNYAESEMLLEEALTLAKESGDARLAAISLCGLVRAAYQQGCKILQSQIYAAHRILEAGDEIVAELEWTGILAVPVMNLPAGSEMRAFVAMFLTFRNGKIVSQRNYDCYSPFDTPSVYSPVHE